MNLLKPIRLRNWFDSRFIIFSLTFLLSHYHHHPNQPIFAYRHFLYMRSVKIVNTNHSFPFDMTMIRTHDVHQETNIYQIILQPISKHNNIIQYVNIENMGDREGIYFRLIHYIQYTFNI
jgi:hypothetical protein